MRAAFVSLTLLLCACNAPPAGTAQSVTGQSVTAASIEPPASVDAPVSVAADPAPSPAAQATPWKVDYAHSSLNFEVNHKVFGALTSTFKTWRADIKFDPNDLAHSSVTVTVPMKDAKMGVPDADAAWPNTEWADPAHYPAATFKAASFKHVGGDKYQAIGALTVKGKSMPATFPFTLTIKGDTADVAGQLKFSRATYDIGMQTDPNGDWVDKTVNVNANVHATRG
jgi:cytochrome b561